MPRSTTRTLAGLTLIAVFTVAGAVLLFSPISPLKSSGGSVLSYFMETADEVQQWVGRQLLAIANDHLGPELTFERIDYLPPATVTLSNVTLDDATTRLLEAESIRITLAERPRRGQPVVIQSVELTGPIINIERTEAGGIAGFDGLVSRDGGAVRDDGGSTRLSDVFEIRSIIVNSATVTYRQPNEPAMRLDDLSADLETTPVDGADGSWYTIACLLGRAPLATLSLDGRFDLDSLLLELEEYEFDAQLSPGQYEMLPPGMQTMLTTHEVRGAVHATGKGTVPLRDMTSATLSASCAVSGMHVVLGDYCVDITQGNVSAAVREQRLSIQSAELAAFSGDVQLSGQLAMNGPSAFKATVTARDVNIEEVAAGRADGESRIRGLLSGECRASGQLAQAEGIDRLSGDGQFRVTQAQLTRIPVIDGLLKSMKKVTTIGDRSDRGNGEFELHESLLRFTAFEFISQSIAARGKGDVQYDGELDLKVNAGPLERIQGALGKVGDIFGAITDRIVSYRITGTFENPKYSVEPLGFKIPFTGAKKDEPAAAETPE